jgi:uncharacterized RDD family membrane protein YckC
MVLAACRSDYLRYIEATFGRIMKLVEGPIDLAAIRQAESTSYSPLVDSVYFWLPAAATIFFWLARSATPGLMAIPARIVDLRTGKKPPARWMLVRFAASLLLNYALGLDYLWIALNKRNTLKAGCDICA